MLVRKYRTHTTKQICIYRLFYLQIFIVPQGHYTGATLTSWHEEFRLCTRISQDRTTGNGKHETNIRQHIVIRWSRDQYCFQARVIRKIRAGSVRHRPREGQVGWVTRTENGGRKHYSTCRMLSQQGCTTDGGGRTSHSSDSMSRLRFGCPGTRSPTTNNN